MSVYKATFGQGLIGYPEHCSLSPDLVWLAAPGEQIRIWRNEDEYAVYTVASLNFADPPGSVRMARAGRERLGTSDTFDATLDTLVVLTATNDEQEQEACSNSEFVERLRGPVQDEALICLAPHGGAIEFETDAQAEMLADLLGVGSWSCKGWRSGGGAFARWHLTSTDISPVSFPGLASLLGTAYARAVAFHGMASPGVIVGGGATFDERSLVGEYLAQSLAGTGVQVHVATQGDALAGASPANLVNWMCAGNGIQIEQGPQVRQEYAQLVVQALAASLEELSS